MIRRQNGRFVLQVIALCFVFDSTQGSECVTNGNTSDCANKGILSIPTTLPSKTTYLNLDGNIITMLRSKSFFQTPHLTNLSVANNPVDTLDRDAFKGLNSLLSLNLSHNQIKSIDDALFGPDLKNLQYLYLQYNSIPKISQNIFDHLVKLQHLHLEHNKLTTIHPHAFNKLVAITSISIDHNSLTTAIGSWFSPVNNTLTRISLGHNPWHCDSKMCGFKNWTQTARKQYSGMIEILCKDSENKTLKDYHTKTLCKAHPTKDMSGHSTSDNMREVGLEATITLVCPDKMSKRWDFMTKPGNGSLQIAHIGTDPKRKIRLGELVITGAEKRDAGSYCCYDTVNNELDTRATQYSKVRHCFKLKVTSDDAEPPSKSSGGGSPGTAVAVIILVVAGVGAVVFWYFRRKRRNYGLLSDESVFQPSYDDPADSSRLSSQSADQGPVSEAYV